ncbi:MAG: aminodeoxychorismate synthase component I [Arcobacteraceae bacterium]|nr:aminodeoxychorismate synthase component I [Arcobacteraceae bacterium]
MLGFNNSTIQELNTLGKNKTPFLVVISFDKSEIDIIPNPYNNENIQFCIDGEEKSLVVKKFDYIKPIDFKEYKVQFDKIIQHIKDGNTYLINLTAPTKIQTNFSLNEIYDNSSAKFKLYYKDKFVCFSPERFIKICGNKIYTYPMKGTIDASVKDAKNKLLNNPKELAEHTMVVDLLRNDLSIVSSNVRVTNFRYIDKISAGEKQLYQISSEIVGDMEENWYENIGSILDELLPAGSITGAPKRSTVRIIQDVEEYDRGFFTGVFGYFDGISFDSGVMIRFLQKNDDGNMVYKSGGGITLDSNVSQEYEELISKVYLA